MRDWLLDRFLDRNFGPDRPLPRWVRALLQETFAWVALGQLLLALGVRPDSVRRLAEVPTALEEACATLGEAGYEIPRLDGIRTFADVDRAVEQLDRLEELELTSEELSELLPAPLLARWVHTCGGILLDIAEEVLTRLRTLGIRTELMSRAGCLPRS